MFKKSIVFITTYILLILLASCEQHPETFEVEEQPTVVKELEAIESNENIETVQGEVPTKSAMEKINPDVLATLDILTDYDREFWFGPDQWGEELWAWKILLKWDQGCDFAPAVSEQSLNSSQYTFITIECTSGAYQPTSYIYLLDKKTKESVQLNLGRSIDSTDLFKEVLGNIKLDTNTNKLSILTVAVGTKTCGTYRKFDFVQGDSVKTSHFELQSTRKQKCIEGVRYEDLPDSVYDYKNWPIVVDE